jgi:hypothetical protein
MQKNIILLISSCFRLQRVRLVISSAPTTMITTPKMMYGMKEEGSLGRFSAAEAADSGDETRSETVKAAILLGGILLFRQ